MVVCGGVAKSSIFAALGTRPDIELRSEPVPGYFLTRPA